MGLRTIQHDNRKIWIFRNIFVDAVLVISYSMIISSVKSTIQSVRKITPKCSGDTICCLRGPSTCSAVSPVIVFLYPALDRSCVPFISPPQPGTSSEKKFQVFRRRRMFVSIFKCRESMMMELKLWDIETAIPLSYCVCHHKHRWNCSLAMSVASAVVGMYGDWNLHCLTLYRNLTFPKQFQNLSRHERRRLQAQKHFSDWRSWIHVSDHPLQLNE